MTHEANRHFKQHTVPERLFLSSPETMSASPFARLAQATHLMGEVIRHCNSDTSHPRGVLAELKLLHEALQSFLKVLSVDKESSIRFHGAVAVCLRY
jgi:hypothetical protein